ncbi:hypothetical protein [Streptomyces boncukensis]|uniref:Uncharacterized protein n=1 Tax=Streptomyces boncukensis TaxID=2711219 RepID=A0A6G4X6S6_9ACTN|nr:hypothetical protein [Streptomyces boncukensis]NGO73088.1 hypothetical protein [Streptomyces boncukensis]
MGSRNPLYRVRVSSSGLIYAVIVGAWAAYLVPMWLRRQDELNEARPTERFSTAIRLLSGKAAMERRYARDAERREAREARETGASLAAATGPESDRDAQGSPDDGYADDAYGTDPDDAAEDAVDVRAFADPKTMVSGQAPEAPTEVHARRGTAGGPPVAGMADMAGSGTRERGQEGRQGSSSAAKSAKRAKLLARRRRTTMVLFLAFTLGTVVAAVGGLAFLWAPAVPGVLLSVYIVHLRAQERRRFTFTMDQRRAEAAARRLHERRAAARAAEAAAGTARPQGPAAPGPAVHGRERARARAERPAPRTPGGPPPSAASHPYGTPGAPGPSGASAPSRAQTRGPAGARRSPAASPAAGSAGNSAANSAGSRPARGPAEDRAAGRSHEEQEEAAADRRALVEQTDHAEWVDQQRARDRDTPEGEGWDPVPVPLPTYVSAPVAPRTARDVDLEAPDAWSSARSSAAPSPSAASEPEPAAGEPAADGSPRSRRARDRARTPLFDQYEDEDRPRAANE